MNTKVRIPHVKAMLLRRRLGSVRTILAVVSASWLLALNPAHSLAASGPLTSTNYDSVPPDSLIYRYWDEQVKSTGRVRYVKDPTGQRGTVQRIEVKSGDTNVFGSSTRNERAEVISTSDLGGFVDGQTIVISWGVFFDSSFTSPANGWSIFSQIHAAGGGNSPPWSLNLAGDKTDLQMGLFGGGNWLKSGQPDGSVKQRFALGQLPKELWHDFVLEVRFGCTGDGHAALWLDRQKLVDAENQAIGYCSDPGMYWKQGVYRAANDTDMTLLFSDTYRWADVEDAFAHLGWDVA